LLAIFASVQALAIVWLVGRRITSDDEPVVWVAARDLQQLTFHQPNFYGQSYGSPFEAALVAMLHVAQVSYPTALSMVLSLLALAPWWVLAFAAHRCGSTRLTIAAAVAPLVLSGYYSVFVAVTPESQVARFLAVIGVAIMMTKPKMRFEALAWTLVGLAAAVDTSTVLLGGPAAAWFLFMKPVRRERLVAMGAGCIVPVGWVAAGAVFYSRLHPDYALHGAPSLRPSLGTLWHSVRRPEHLFNLYVFELLRSAVLPILMLAVLIALLLWTRRRASIAASIAATAVLLFALSTPKAQEDLGPFLPSGRILLVLPFAMWFFAFVIADTGWRPTFTVDQRVVVVGLVALAAASFGARAIWPADRVLHWRDYASSPALFGYRFDRTEDVSRRCNNLRSLATRNGAQLVVLDTIVLAYACDVLEAPRLRTLLPRFDRRTWRMYDELRRSRHVALFWDVRSDFCAVAAPQFMSCRMIASHGAVARFAPQSVLSVLAAVGWPIRPFGPACHPHGERFTWSAAQSTSVITLTCSHPLAVPRAAEHRSPP